MEMADDQLSTGLSMINLALQAVAWTRARMGS